MKNRGWPKAPDDSVLTLWDYVLTYRYVNPRDVEGDMKSRIEMISQGAVSMMLRPKGRKK